MAIDFKKLAADAISNADKSHLEPLPRPIKPVFVIPSRSTTSLIFQGQTFEQYAINLKNQIAKQSGMIPVKNGYIKTSQSHPNKIKGTTHVSQSIHRTRSS